MRRVSTLLILLLLLACRLSAPVELPGLAPVDGTATRTPVFTAPTAVLLPPTATALASTATASPSPLPPTPIAAQPSYTASPPSLRPAALDFTVIVHPDGGLYVGDLVSLEVVPPLQADLAYDNVHVSLAIGTGQESLSGAVAFGPYGIGGRDQATLYWLWDTRDLAAGDYPLVFTVQPGSFSWSETLTLLPADELPFPEAQAEWQTARSQYCTLHYLTYTAADRDLDWLLAQADAQAQAATQRMGVEFSDPITVTLLPRVLGHGGFANREVNISYLDRNYAGSNFTQVLHHEMIHILDFRLSGDLRPSLFVEGLAVYLTGGHFKPEPLLPRAAALLEEGGLGWYIPLETLTGDFYAAQHEISYLEGGALVEYMVQTWSWAQFSAFYRDIHPVENGSTRQAIDAALQAHFDLTFEQLEADFIAALQAQPEDPRWQEDVRLTVGFYDTVRRYQQLYDPSAYFAAAWLLDSAELRRRGIAADVLRHPAGRDNLVLETMLIAANQALVEGRYAETETLLAALNAVLSAAQAGAPDPLGASSIAADYRAIVSALLDAGYQPQRIVLQADAATAWVTPVLETVLVEIKLFRAGSIWRIE